MHVGQAVTKEEMPLGTKRRGCYEGYEELGQVIMEPITRLLKLFCACSLE